MKSRNQCACPCTDAERERDPARTRDAESMIVVLEQRVPVETNHLVSDAAAPELVADGLGDHDDDLCEKTNVSRGEKG